MTQLFLEVVPAVSFTDKLKVPIAGSYAVTLPYINSAELAKLTISMGCPTSKNLLVSGVDSASIAPGA